MGTAYRAVPLLLAILCLFAHPAQAQSSDLVVTLAASKRIDLRAGDEILVSTTVRNEGPSPVAGVFVSAGQVGQELFPFNLVGSESPECGAIGELEPDPPPQYLFYWSVGPVPVGGVVTCTARLLLVRVPTGLSSGIGAYASPSGAPLDPDMSDNFAEISLSFASPRQPNAIPSGSWPALVVIVLGLLIAVAPSLRR